MKLRIKGNSLRIRLNRTEVATFAEEGYLEEQTVFGENKFVYALKSDAGNNELSAKLEQNKITMLVPASFIEHWAVNDIVGLDTRMPISSNNSLYLLLEKDFVCLDETVEDQSDNYENPNKSC